jgi:hypothetical protein
MRPTRMTTRRWMTVVAVVALLTAWASVFLSPVQPSDGIVWKTFQFGVMSPETTGQKVWPIANAGRVPLQVYCVCSGFGTTIHGDPAGRKGGHHHEVADTSSDRPLQDLCTPRYERSEYPNYWSLDRGIGRTDLVRR